MERQDHTGVFGKPSFVSIPGPRLFLQAVPYLTVGENDIFPASKLGTWRDWWPGRETLCFRHSSRLCSREAHVSITPVSLSRRCPSVLLCDLTSVRDAWLSVFVA